MPATFDPDDLGSLELRSYNDPDNCCVMQVDPESLSSKHAHRYLNVYTGFKAPGPDRPLTELTRATLEREQVVELVAYLACWLGR